MTLPFIAAVTAMLIAALFLILLPLLRGSSGTLRRLRESRAELGALEEARPTLEAADYASRRAALGESLLSILDTEPRRHREIRTSHVNMQRRKPRTKLKPLRGRRRPTPRRAPLPPMAPLTSSSTWRSIRNSRTTSGRTTRCSSSPRR